MFDFIYAYAPLFENLDLMLTNDKKYNKDVFRRGKFVAKATAEVSQYIPIPVIKDIVKRYNFKTILDLGCGSAEFLLEICDSVERTAYGIDISIDAIAFAKEIIHKKGLSDKVQVAVGDIFKVNQLKQAASNVDAITSMFVIHEFLSQGRDVVVNLLKTIKQTYPNKYFIICELTRFAPEVLRKAPTSIAEHHLFHALSEQNLLTVEEWHSVFKEAGYKIVEEVKYDFAGQAYFILI